MKLHFTTICLVLSVCFSTLWAQTTLPAGFVNNRVQSGYTQPLGMVFSKDGQKMFVWEKKGLVWQSNWNGTTYIKQPNPVLNISEEVADWRDMGLQTMCLDPNFDSNGFIYLYYQVDRHHLLNYGKPSYDPNKTEELTAMISRIAKYRLINNNNVYSADLSSRKILLGDSPSNGVPSTHESHVGGTILFGTDGSLMVSTGDGASYANADFGSAAETYYQQALSDQIIRSDENVGSYRAQMLSSLGGKILRIDANTGAGLASNPFYDANNPYSAKSKVWSMGYRNPYRMSLKPNTGSANINDGNPGTLFVTEVGASSWEDFHVIDKGGLNAGWPIYEGLDESPGYYYNGRNLINQEEGKTFNSLLSQPTSNTLSAIPAERRLVHSRPAMTYAHDKPDTRVPTITNNQATSEQVGAGSITGNSFAGYCIIGGVYYTGTNFPATYRNRYFFADYAINWFKTMELHDSGDHLVHDVSDFSPNSFSKGVVYMIQNPIKETIYYVNYDANEIFELSYGGNQAPTAVATANALYGTAPMTVSFFGTNSKDPEGYNLSYLWEFGDGSNSTEANPTKTFYGTGTQSFEVKLTVKDVGGLTDTKILTVSINNTPPTVTITNPINNSKYPLDKAINTQLTAAVKDDDPSGLIYNWQVSLRHNTHEHKEPILTQESPTIQISPVGCDGDTYYYLIELTVKDKGGLIAKDSVKLYPDCASQSFSVKNVLATPRVNAVDLTWQNPTIAFDEIMVAAIENQGFSNRPEGTNYTADANFIGAGTDFHGGKIVYKGTGTSVNITNLSAYKNYYFRVFTRSGTSWTGGVEVSALPLAAQTCSADGQLSVETWFGVDGSCVSEINFANPPTTSVNKPFTNLEIDSNIGDKYGMRIRGYLCPPENGNYTFFIASDDGGELYLSTDDNPANKVKIAYMPNCSWAFPREFRKYVEQASPKLNLMANRKYYIEILYKEGVSGDNMAIGWLKPSNTAGTIELVQGASLAVFSGTTTTGGGGTTTPTIASCDNIQATATAGQINITNIPLSSAEIKLFTKTFSSTSYTNGLKPISNGTLNIPIQAGTYILYVGLGSPSNCEKRFDIIVPAVATVDADGDGVPSTTDPNDNDKCVPNTNLGICDTDGDGLSNDQELTIGTHAANADTDGDGVKDGTDKCPLVFAKTADGCLIITPPTPTTSSCDAVLITGGAGQFTISGLAGSSAFVQVFTSTWGATGFANGDKTFNGTSLTFSLTAGSYIVKVGLIMNGAWCEKTKNITVTSGTVAPVVTIIDADSDGVPSTNDPNDNDKCVPNPNFGICDTDGDGLTNDQELNMGTNATNSDTDSDGVKDGVDKCPLQYAKTSDGCLATTTASTCEAVTASGGVGQFTISGLTGNSVFVQLFTSTWGATSFVNGNKIFNGTVLTVPFAAGSYIIKFGLMVNGAWCEKTQNITVTNATTTPTVVDADGDGVSNTTDPNDNDKCIPFATFGICDPDEDGLTNDQEKALGTNTINADTDGDGVKDAVDACPLQFAQTANGCLVITTTAGLFDPNKCYQFTAQHSGKIMQVLNGFTFDKANIVQFTNQSQTHQVWKIVKVEEGFYRIENFKSGKALEIMDASAQSYVSLVQNTYVGGDYQRWALEPTTDGYYVVKSKFSKLVASVAGAFVVDGANIFQLLNSNASNQKWKINEIACTAARSDNDELHQQFVVFPNPTAGLIQVALGSYIDKMLKIEIQNELGQSVLIQEILPLDNMLSVDLSDFSSGMYFMKIMEEGKKPFISKISLIKE